MPARRAFEYAIIRVMPRIERGEFVNAGVVLFCRAGRFLGAEIALDRIRLAALAPAIDSDAIQEQLDHIPLICRGGRLAGPIGELAQPERFRWLTSPRSTIVQPSTVHCGICHDPQATLDHLLATMVRT